MIHRMTPLLIALLCWTGPALGQPTNIILMIGDGMGPNHVTAYRHFRHLGTGEVPPTILDELLVGLSSTHPGDDTIVTDSASSATALATGHKTCNRFIAMTCNQEPIPTLFQKAKQRDMLTGIAVTSQVYHATPAPFYAHQRSRSHYAAIADQLVDNRVDGALPVDVIFGGGKRNMIRNDRNLAEELRGEGYDYANTWEAVDALSKPPALALLADSGLPSALDNPVVEPLARLTSKALELLAQGENGFVLMVEGSQIDWCSHANDIACTLAEMHDFAAAVAVAKRFVDDNPNTLLVITGDHETGGLSLGANNEYQWHAAVIRAVTLTANTLSQKMRDSRQWQELWHQHTGITPTISERRALHQARGRSQEALADAIKAIINQRSHTGWTSGGHTAADVPIMAYGAGSERFHGFVDNAEIGRRLLKFLD